MFKHVLESLLNFFFDALKVFLYTFSCIIIPFFFMFFVFFLYNFIRGNRLPKRKKLRTYHYVQRFNPVKVLFWELPMRFIADTFGKDPDAFDTYGVHVFSGEQGSGKSIAAVHFIKCMMERNPCAKLASNISLNFQDAVISDWTDILRYNNGSDGQIIFLDEIQNWFSSNESRNFPPDMLTEITQQRKQRKCVVATSQVFTRISKPIREQITLLYKPFTVFGCLTVVRVYKVALNDDGSTKDMRRVRTYCFVHDEELRNSYDTYQKVLRQSLVGFQPRSDENNVTVTNVILQKK